MPFRMALFQFYQIVAKYYLKTLLRSLKVATLAADNARLSIILIQSLFLIKERYFRFFLFPLRFKLSFKLYVFYFYRIFHILSFLFLRTLTMLFLNTPDRPAIGRISNNVHFYHCRMKSHIITFGISPPYMTILSSIT